MPQTKKKLMQYQMETLEIITNNYTKTAEGLRQAYEHFNRGATEKGIEALKAVGFAQMFGLEG